MLDADVVHQWCSEAGGYLGQDSGAGVGGPSDVLHGKVMDAVTPTVQRGSTTCGHRISQL